jgi:uncharacterized membrane protein YhiD involved in acid resistance
MGHDDLVIIVRVTGALVIGALIGFERTTGSSMTNRRIVIAITVIA